MFAAFCWLSLAAELRLFKAQAGTLGSFPIAVVCLANELFEVCMFRSGHFSRCQSFVDGALHSGQIHGVARRTGRPQRSNQR